MTKYIVKIFMNETDSIFLSDVLFVGVIDNVVKVTRFFDEPIFDLHEIFKIEIREQE